MKAIGYAWLIQAYRLDVLEPSSVSYIHERSDRRSVEENGRTESYYPRGYDPGSEWTGNLAFALKHEGLNLEVLSALFPKLDHSAVEAYVKESPIGKYARCAWYFYELLTERMLGLPDLDTGNYLPILDEEREFAIPLAVSRRVKRQRLIVNLLGGKEYCPRIRRTEAIEAFHAADIAASVRALVAAYPDNLVGRASRYLYAKETKSSFDIERERADTKRTSRFIELLKRAGRIDPYGEKTLTALQNAIVEERYIDNGYRTTQNYVGESIGPTREFVHYIPPKPQDLGSLMVGWASSCRQIRSGALDALVLATVAGFGFVFLHPFEDGNGRIHRFLIHDALVATGFTPEGMIFPVSAVMLRRMKEYDASLEAYSRPCMERLQYVLDGRGTITVQGETGRHYRYPDLTRQAEALASFVQETAQEEFSTELEYLSLFDQVAEAVRSLLDMPDRKLELFVRLCLQGKGKISASKRGLFPEITDGELAELESAAAPIISSRSQPGHGRGSILE